MLFAEFGIRIPARIKKHKQRPDFVLLRDAQKNIYTFLESRVVLLPEQVMQEHAHRVQSQRFRPTEFRVDPLRIEALRLPHFEFIDRRGRNVVTADEPGLLRVPIIRRLFCPPSGLRLRTRRKPEDYPNDRDQTFPRNGLSPFPLAIHSAPAFCNSSFIPAQLCRVDSSAVVAPRQWVSRLTAK